MLYFVAIGKVISDCGLINVMVESSTLANGSVMGFLMESTSTAAKDYIVY